MQQYVRAVLDSTQKKFDILYLSDNATRPVERAAEIPQPIQTSKLCRIEFV